MDRGDEKKDDKPQGSGQPFEDVFTTASGKPISVKPSSLARARKLFSNLNDPQEEQEKKEEEPSEQEPPQKRPRGGDEDDEELQPRTRGRLSAMAPMQRPVIRKRPTPAQKPAEVTEEKPAPVLGRQSQSEELPSASGPNVEPDKRRSLPAGMRLAFRGDSEAEERDRSIRRVFERQSTVRREPHPSDVLFTDRDFEVRPVTEQELPSYAAKQRARGFRTPPRTLDVKSFRDVAQTSLQTSPITKPFNIKGIILRIEKNFAWRESRVILSCDHNRFRVLVRMPHMFAVYQKVYMEIMLINFVVNRSEGIFPEELIPVPGCNWRVLKELVTMRSGLPYNLTHSIADKPFIIDPIEMSQLRPIGKSKFSQHSKVVVRAYIVCWPPRLTYSGNERFVVSVEDVPGLIFKCGNCRTRVNHKDKMCSGCGGDVKSPEQCFYAVVTLSDYTGMLQAEMSHDVLVNFLAQNQVDKADVPEMQHIQSNMENFSFHLFKLTYKPFLVHMIRPEPTAKHWQIVELMPVNFEVYNRFLDRMAVQRHVRIPMMIHNDPTVRQGWNQHCRPSRFALPSVNPSPAITPVLEVAEPVPMEQGNAAQED